MRALRLRVLPRAHIPAVTALFLLNLSACDWMQVKDNRKAGEARTAAARVKRVQLACASSRTYDRLKDLAFNEAIRIRNADPVNLDKLATYSVIRMENPRVRARDDRLDVTVCGGRLILHLPPGAERGFNGVTHLEADVQYTAQAAADGSGLIYQLSGADPIIYRLAAFDLKGHKYDPPAEPEQKLAEASPVVPAGPPVQSAQLLSPPTPSTPVPTQAQAAAAPPAPKQVAKDVPAIAAAPSALLQAGKAVDATPAKRPVEVVRVAAAKPDEPQVRKSVAETAPARATPSHLQKAVAAADPSRPARRADRVAPATAKDPKPRRATSVAAAARPTARHAKRSARTAPAPKLKAVTKGPALAAASPARSRVKPSSQPMKRPVQTAQAATPRPAVRKPAAPPVRPSSAPAVVIQASAAPRPPVSTRLAGLAAAIAASEKPVQKASPTAPAPRPGPPTSMPRSQSSKIANQSAGAVPRTVDAPVRRTAPAPRQERIAPFPPPVRPVDDCRFCGNARLASLDRSVRRLYSAALNEADSEARSELQRTRRRFAAYLDSCVTESCIARAYQGRMAEIRDIMTER